MWVLSFCTSTSRSWTRDNVSHIQIYIGLVCGWPIGAYLLCWVAFFISFPRRRRLASRRAARSCFRRASVCLGRYLALLRNQPTCIAAIKSQRLLSDLRQTNSAIYLADGFVYFMSTDRANVRQNVLHCSAMRHDDASSVCHGDEQTSTTWWTKEVLVRGARTYLGRGWLDFLHLTFSI